MPTLRTRDRRVRRTETLLRAALAELVHEKPYSQIVVKEILSRANVGRSTFYTPFRDKDDLLASCIREALPLANPVGARRSTSRWPERILAFSRPLFEHVDEHRRAMRTSTSPADSRALHARLEHTVAETLEAELCDVLRASGEAAPARPELVARWIAATFRMVLDWWLEQDEPLPASEADRVFRLLVEPALAERLG